LPSNPENKGIEENLFRMYFILKRWLNTPIDLTLLEQDNSVPASWKQGDFMELPKDKKY
jgi:hypothetical protein